MKLSYDFTSGVYKRTMQQRKVTFFLYLFFMARLAIKYPYLFRMPGRQMQANGLISGSRTCAVCIYWNGRLPHPAAKLLPPHPRLLPNLSATSVRGAA